jgi:hypothetical protein
MTWDGAHGFVKEKKWFYKRKEKVWRGMVLGVECKKFEVEWW